MNLTFISYKQPYHDNFQKVYLHGVQDVTYLVKNLVRQKDVFLIV